MNGPSHHRPSGNNRFKTHIRHYHRSVGQPQRTWDEWVDQKSANQQKTTIKWPRIIAYVLALAILASIIIGLIIELR
ncbi:MAG: hypothetical protein ACQCXQ_15120 [Verrucomicrobiales bacterium]|nr:hypothetical protein [Verrucomicrobiota bacterium JB025]